jgi:hypothetical protein
VELVLVVLCLGRGEEIAFCITIFIYKDAVYFVLNFALLLSLLVSTLARSVFGCVIELQQPRIKIFFVLCATDNFHLI